MSLYPFQKHICDCDETHRPHRLGRQDLSKTAIALAAFDDFPPGLIYGPNDARITDRPEVMLIRERPPVNSFLLKLFPICVLALATVSRADEFPEPVNTQAAGEHPPSPKEMLELFELPPGFKVTLFAGEPDVQQPIAFDFDDHGRIWVAENYTYSARGKVDQVMRDRVIILHDKDGDGQHDERKVFWDKGKMLTGLTWGYGGLWILNDGTLSFIPDKDGDDVPDSEPVPMLNGWTKNAGHNVVNGLLWGPDGWLYGRHGITDTSYPGTIDTPKEERKPLNCGIWRFHPVKHTFEIVCHGTTNPWGLDYNEVGDMFMSNNVIGHLWHVIPGAHYQRMFGQDFNPHCYELMGPISDHYHWDESGKWSESRDGKADDLGGGHSHCGLMLYYGQNFPKEYWGKAFMCNTHGRCVNVDRIERKGSSYVAKHEPNFLRVNTPWFRGVQLAYGPAGCMYLSDWSDNGECHDHDGVHRTSGRIYRISYGEVKNIALDLTTYPAIELAMAIPSLTSECYRRKGARLFVEKYAYSNSSDNAKVSGLIGNSVEGVRDDGTEAFRRLSLLGSVDIYDSAEITRAMLSDKPFVRAFAVRQCRTDRELLQHLEPTLVAWLNHEESPVVLGAYLELLQQLDYRVGGVEHEILLKLLANQRLVEIVERDEVLSHMMWYALEHATRQWPFWNTFIPYYPSRSRYSQIRRLTSNWNENSTEVTEKIEQYAMSLSRRMKRDRDTAVSDGRDLLQAVRSGLAGQLKIEAPTNWLAISDALHSGEDKKITQLTNEISSVFGTKVGFEALANHIRDRSGDHTARSRAITTLAQSRSNTAVSILLPLLNDRAVYVDICKALAAFDDDPRIPKELLKRWNNLRHGAQEAAADTLCSRKSYAVEFTKAIADGRVDSGMLTATQVRQLHSFGDESITAVVNKHWGVINETPEAIHASIAKWKQQLTVDVLASADLVNGAALFKKTCANCHRLYGEGGKIGPDLTGGNRANMDYLLGNVIDPSAEVPKQYTTSVIALKSGRVITGVIVGETASVLSVQTDRELMKIAVSDVDERSRSNKSLMPDGLLDALTAAQVRDLVAFVQRRR